MKISQIIDKIDEKQLFVPAFQREYVWKRNDAKELINSLIKDYPTGTMLTWETGNPPELKGKHKYDPRQGSVKLILDGQQRITTLYMLMTNQIPPYYKEHEILHNIRGLYVNVESLDLEYYKKTIMEKAPFWVNITDIFKGTVRYRDVVDQLEEQLDGERLPRSRENIIDDNFRAIERIKDRDFQEQVIPINATIKEAIDIFYVVNSAGVNLTDAELALAQITGYWPEARELFKKKLLELAANGFVLKLDFIVYVLLGVLYNIGSKMERLHNIENLESIKIAWEKLNTDILDYVFNILKSQAYIDHTKEVNSVYAFIPIIVYAYQKGKNSLSQIEIKKVIKWFYYSQIRQRYISQLPQKLDKDLKIIVNEDNPFDKLLNIIALERKLEIEKEEFIGVDVRHALWSLMKFYFKSKDAKCLSTGISIRKNMGKKYDLEWDHIFPYSVLKAHGYDWNNRRKFALAQEITNRAILTQVANRTKSAKLAEGYLEGVLVKFPNALELQSIPVDKELWKIENYDLFLEQRRKMLANELNAFLNGITETDTGEVDLDILEMINQGETHHVEFKTTLRYDVRQQKVNKKLEEVILKTIAAFSNGQGGNLIMGVKDDMEVIGLENDYNTLKDSTHDGFELHLRNLVNTAYGVEFASNNLMVSFPVVDETEICLVEVKPSLKPVYTQATDKNGQRHEKFYVRSGNSSPEMPLSEIASYIQSRFNSD
ncbi:MAG: DUF262 domain-containing protein [Desulfobacula sp.]|jgi:hypothetical protein|uniref:GmrSD restriction endonuclease domain-containing protein n=2 Tax=Desulfobacula sp. TaxID=2593537 RepID=UPI001DD90803|nr:DUF262 domain-containing protein [Desulfobacula sp.]MBT3486599.1 DUF262 domain-containing protein [Desulfobacula sp.]MBT3805696.1 DUF262 domain-containing protein [Desulfobacula sp.]MBT4023876.1 DUF262 domain-containing protein [Desulfobacula sp.]MBT4198998.1 DUF262 domain-containing protein [Desulfobacula sp.]